MGKLKRYDKALLMLSTIFFISLLILGVIPYMISDGSFWDYSLFTNVIGVIVGLIIFGTAFAYFYVSIFHSIMFDGVTRYLRILETVGLFLILQYVAPEQEYFTISESLIITLIIGISIITIDFFAFFYYRKKQMSNILTMDKLRELKKSTTLTSYKDGEFLFSLCVLIIMVLFLVDIEIGQLSSYILLVLVNLFLLNKYIQLTSKTKEVSKVLFLITIILSGISIILLEIFTSFFLSDKILYVMMFIIPTIYIYPNIMKNYHDVMWTAYFTNEGDHK